MRLLSFSLSLLLLFVLAACAPIAAPAPPSDTPPATLDSSLATKPATPRPIRLPEDDAPHDVLTEWWYYTGHLRAEDGRQFGFEFVIFQSIRGRNPIGYLSHFAVTDRQRGRFRFALQAEQRSAISERLDLSVGGWTLRGGGGRDQLAAEMDDYALELSVVAQKPPALHHGGLITYGPAGDSYYYSRTRMAASGRLRDGETWLQVEGQAWFDHQWGNFIVPAVGGWDWFSVQLDDGSDVMFALYRSPDGNVAGPAGTFVDSTGRAIEVPFGAMTLEPTGAWTSPRTGVRYPSGWQAHLPSRPEAGQPEIRVRLDPVLPDQELAFESLSYWEGQVDVSGSVAGSPVAGKGYVELTGYQ